MRLWLTCAALVMGLVAAMGCSRGGPSDKNSNLDRPKPAEPIKNQ